MSGKSNPLLFEDVAVDEEQIRVARTVGTGTPLVICNEFAANIEILADFAAALGRPVLLFDCPGVGRSLPPRRLRRMPALARLLAALLDAVDLSAPVDVMGIGWGGMLAQQFARSYPYRLRRLVLAATSSGQVMFPGRLRSLWRAAQPRGLTGMPDAPAQARALFGGRRGDACALTRQALACATEPTRKGHAAQLYALAGFTSLPWLHRITVPTLVLAGDDDPIVPTVNVRMLAFLMPRARLHIVRGGGHWFVLERTDETVRLLAGFLQSGRSATLPPDNGLL